MDASGLREPDLDALLATAGVTVRQNDVVLDLGCGAGHVTRALARRAAHVIALDVSREALRRAREYEAPNNVTWLLGNGASLDGVEDDSLDGAVSHGLFHAIRDAKVTLGYVAELGRVLKPGAWAAFALSTDPRPGEPPAPERPGTSRRELLRGLAGRRPPERQAQRHVAAGVPLEALGAVATAAGLTLEDIDGAGTRHTVVRATRSRAS
jgi:SAM-dependent methyltransferase